MTTLLIAVIYLIFISLGLPDSLLGSAWPIMHKEMLVPSSYAGYISMSISVMTIISALMCPRLLKKYETKYIVVVSIALTIIGLLGFSFSNKYALLFIFAIPYGLGAGAIDSSINTYVANHYSSRVMNFLHCFYGVGAVISPNIMALALKHARWNEGYRWTAYIQIFILLVCLLSLPLWNQNKESDEEIKDNNVKLKDVIKKPGVLLTLIAFFAYCAGEMTCFLWVPSFFAYTRIDLSKEMIASFGSLIFGGLMLGRLISGFISNKLDDRSLIRIGIFIELIGIILIFLPIENYLFGVIGFVIIGIGMGPIYPSIQHMAPINFGKENASAIISLQMASAYIGSTLIPTLFGYLQEIFGMRIMPLFLLFFAFINILFLEITYKVIEE